MNKSDTNQAKQLNETAVNHSVLTLEHLAPYLPYGLRLVARNVFSDNPRRIFSELSATNIMSLVENDTLYKPILKPISDLEKIIFDEFEKYNIVFSNRHSSIVYKQEIIDLFSIENTGFEETLTEFETLDGFPYECVKYMFENYYDVFGLIQKGLAVSIHDVE